MEVKTSHNPNFHIWPENSLNVKRPCWEGGQVYFTHRTIITPQSSPRDCWWGLLQRKYSKLLGVYKSTTRTPVLPLRDIMEKSLPLTTIPEAMRMDKFTGYLNIGTGININAWSFSDSSLSVAISPCLCAVFSKNYWVGLNSRGSRMVVDMVFTRGTVLATMSFHSG